MRTHVKTHQLRVHVAALRAPQITGQPCQRTHGILPGENIVHGEFHVDSQIIFNEDIQIESIDETIDYTKIYEIIKQRMIISGLLLETLAMQIGNEIINKFPYVKFVRVDIKKVNPPIEGIIGSVGVSWYKNIN